MKNKIIAIALSLLIAFNIIGLVACNSKPVSIEYITLTFETNGGTDIASMKTQKGKKFDKPSQPYKVGYTFDDWYAENTYINKFDFSKIYETDITIYAKWVAQIYNIHYNSDGGTLSDDAPKTHTYGVDTQLIGAEKLGFTFLSWVDNTSGSSIAGQDIMVLRGSNYTSDVYLESKWVAQIYNIYYNSDGGTLSDDAPKTHTYGVDTQLIGAEKVGHTFVGWEVNKSGVTSIVSILKGDEYISDIELTAKYDVNVMSIQYNNATSDEVQDLPKTHTYGIDTTVGDISRIGWKFEGWYTNATFDGNPINVINGDYANGGTNGAIIPLYAKWSGLTYSIVFKDMDGSDLDTSYDLPIDLTHTNGTATTLPTLTKANQIEGNSWTLTKYGAGGSFSSLSSSVTYSGANNTITLYVNWTSKFVMYNAVSGGYEVKKEAISIGGDVEIPMYYKGGTVVAVADDGFWNNTGYTGSLANMILPNSVTKIGINAFRDCKNLESINMLQVSTVGQRAFASCTKLLSVSLPQVKIIDSYAFDNASQLQEVLLGNVESIGGQAFRDCFQLESIVLPNSCKTLGTGVFAVSSNITPLPMKVTVYTEYVTKPSGWNSQWLILSYTTKSTTIWGVVVANENDYNYVGSINKTDTTIDKNTPTSVINNPSRIGYRFNKFGIYSSIEDIPSGENVELVWDKLR